MAAAMLDALYHPPTLDGFTGPIAGWARRVVGVLRDGWERTIREAAAARGLPELHATRDDYKSSLEIHLRLIGQLQELGDLHERTFGADPARSEALAAAADGLRQLYDELFPRWQTLDDLYRIVIDRLTPSPERVAYLAAKYPPPPSWYDETDDPFTAE